MFKWVSNRNMAWSVVGCERGTYAANKCHRHTHKTTHTRQCHSAQFRVRLFEHSYVAFARLRWQMKCRRLKWLCACALPYAQEIGVTIVNEAYKYNELHQLFRHGSRAAEILFPRNRYRRQPVHLSHMQIKWKNRSSEIPVAVVVSFA